MFVKNYKRIILVLMLLTVSVFSVSCNSNVTDKLTEDTPEEKTSITHSSADFIQAWLCADWSVEEFTAHLDKLKLLGINSIILQSTISMDDGGVTECYYPGEYASANMKEGYTYSPTNTVLNLLTAAKAIGFKVFLGLNSHDGWWETENMNSTWLTNASNIDNTIATELYTLYHENFADTLQGWYFVYEMYNNPFTGWFTLWSDMINNTLAHLTALDSSLPLLLSPYYSTYYAGTMSSIETKWSDFFEKTNFRAGDIVAPQDSFGMAEATATQDDIDFVKSYLTAFSNAAKHNANITFWVNCEIFTPDYGNATKARFNTQLEVASGFTDTVITFSFSHYTLTD